MWAPSAINSDIRLSSGAGVVVLFGVLCFAGCGTDDAGNGVAPGADAMVPIDAMNGDAQIGGMGGMAGEGGHAGHGGVGGQGGTAGDAGVEICELPGRVTMRRLNRSEYDNTVRDLLGDKSRPGRDFPEDDIGEGFDNIAEILSTSPILSKPWTISARALTISEMC